MDKNRKILNSHLIILKNPLFYVEKDDNNGGDLSWERFDEKIILLYDDGEVETKYLCYSRPCSRYLGDDGDFLDKGMLFEQNEIDSNKNIFTRIAQHYLFKFGDDEKGTLFSYLSIYIDAKSIGLDLSKYISAEYRKNEIPYNLWEEIWNRELKK